MSNDRRDDDETSVDPALLAQWKAQEPSEGFADRVMAARASEVSAASSKEETRRGNRWIVPLVSAAAAALLTWSGVRSSTTNGTGGAAKGELAFENRQQLGLGERATVVAESGSSLKWDVDASGAANVNQERGRVFYRVERGGAFVVHTPAGDVTVKGTCFDVEVENMKKNNLTMGAAGLALGVAVSVTVYEGRVALANPQGEVSVGPGERARAMSDDAPRLVASRAESLQKDNERLRRQRDELQTQLDDAETQVRSVMKARAEGKDPLVVENERLQDEVRRARTKLDEQKVVDKQKQGKTFPFPENFPEAYREDGLRQNFVDSLKEAGIDGDVRSIDCNEFPCVVYGDAKVDGDKVASEAQVKAMEEALRKRYPDEGHSMHESIWTTGKKDDDGVERQRIHFALSVYPKDTIDDSQREDVRKRLRYRNQEYFEASGE